MRTHANDGPKESPKLVTVAAAGRDVRPSASQTFERERVVTWDARQVELVAVLKGNPRCRHASSSNSGSFLETNPRGSPMAHRPAAARSAK